MKAAFWSTVITLLVAFVRKETRPKLSDILNPLEKGSCQVIAIVASCATTGIIVGIIAMTGLALNYYIL